MKYTAYLTRTITLTRQIEILADDETSAADTVAELVTELLDAQVEMRMTDEWQLDEDTTSVEDLEEID